MITVTDLFCGAGGSGLGAHAVPGVRLRIAANHWQLAVDTHAGNFLECDHDCADISQANPRRYPYTDILWASPECTNHSGAKGVKRVSNQASLFGDEELPDEAAERSRATMWDVPRFAEHHRYKAVIVENVVEAAKWVMWPAWLQAMTLLGYRHKTVYLNSMHAAGIRAPRAPQSRDRLYVVFWRNGDRAPNLDIRPTAWCPTCEIEVSALQSWKKPGAPWGRYRAQYVYRCPKAACRNSVIEPYADPAAVAIDWSLPGQRIGDRDKPLSEKTMARIRVGLERYGQPLVVPVEGREGKVASSVTTPIRTMTARSETGLLVPYYGTGVAHPTTEPVRTVSTVDRFGLAFIAELRGGGSDARDVRQPLATVTASGNHHGLVTADRVATKPAVEDCSFRMLEPSEIGRAMAFRADYQVLGNRRERVRQYGNAVTPPAAEWLIGAVVEALTGEAIAA